MIPHNEHGITGSGTAPGNASLQRYFPGAVVRRNVIVGALPGRYPRDNFFPSSLSEIGLQRRRQRPHVPARARRLRRRPPTAPARRRHRRDGSGAWRACDRRASDRRPASAFAGARSVAALGVVAPARSRTRQSPSSGLRQRCLSTSTSAIRCSRRSARRGYRTPASAGPSSRWCRSSWSPTTRPSGSSRASRTCSRSTIRRSGSTSSIASDGSSDDTVRAGALPPGSRRPSPGLCRAPRQAGRAQRGRPLAARRHRRSSPMPVSSFDPGTLRALVDNFADPTVGAVGGELVLTTKNGPAAAGRGAAFYWRYEKFIRSTEARADSTIGATGAIYAIRRRLFEPIPDDTILDDVVIPLRIVRQGYRVVFEPQARAHDAASPTARQEFVRKARTIAGTFQLFARERWLLDPRRNRLWFETVSHKALRLALPLLHLALLATSGLLATQWLVRMGAGRPARLLCGGAGRICPAPPPFRPVHRPLCDVRAHLGDGRRLRPVRHATAAGHVGTRGVDYKGLRRGTDPAGRRIAYRTPADAPAPLGRRRQRSPPPLERHAAHGAVAGRTARHGRASRSPRAPCWCRRPFRSSSTSPRRRQPRSQSVSPLENLTSAL